MDYKAELQDLIKKQIVILGPDTVMSKVKNVEGLEVSSEGEITKLDGDPKVALEKLVDQFIELSSLIVKKTMETLESPKEKTEVSSAPVSSETPVVPSAPEPEAQKTEFPVPSADPKVGETAPTGMRENEKSFDPPISPDAKMDLEKIATEVNKAAEQAAMNKPADAASLSDKPAEAVFPSDRPDLPSDKPADAALPSASPTPEVPSNPVSPLGLNSVPTNTVPAADSLQTPPAQTPEDTKPQV